MNFPRLLDCIDPNKADSRYSDGGVRDYTKFAFKEEVIADSSSIIFRPGFHDLPQASTEYTFVTESFYSIINRSALQGFRFVEVWDSNQK